MIMAQKTTLVIIHPHFTIPGGAGKMMLELGKRLSDNFQIVVIAQKVNNEYKKNYPEIIFEDLGGPITDSFRFWLRLPHWRKKTHSLINKYNSQGKTKIISSVFPANWLSLSYKKRHKEIETFWFCQEPSAFIHIKKWRSAIKNPLKRLIANTFAPIFAIYDKKITAYADKLFSNSEFSKNKIKEIYGRNSTIIYPGIDSKKFHTVDFEDKDNYILTVGRLTKFKNIDLLVSAFAKLKNRKISLKIIGDGEEKDNLDDLAKQLGVFDRVEILSGLSDSEVADIYAKAKMFVLCSKEEPFGIVPVEAMASGTMAIADNSGGPREIIDNNLNGVLIDNMNARKLAKCIDGLLLDENRIKKLSSNARKKAVEHFAWEISAKKLMKELQCISI
jgi:glycosyltransferase involved in cell wall biosynthesis